MTIPHAERSSLIPPPAPADGSGGGWPVKAWHSRWFVACLVLLAIFTVGFEVQFRNFVIKKEALPLKRDLSLLNREKLQFQDPASGKSYSYRLEGQPTQLPSEMVDALGTDKYVAWHLRLWDDTERRATDTSLELFVTYYTGKPDQVPHVPEQCFRGNGYTEVNNRLVRVSLPQLAEKDREAPVQVLTFEPNTNLGNRVPQVVMYLFRANDTWVADRERVRTTVGNPLARYAYFSKIEVTFALREGNKPEAVERTIEAGKRFLQVVLPVLVHDHFREWPTGNQEKESKVAAEKAGN